MNHCHFAHDRAWRPVTLAAAGLVAVGLAQAQVGRSPSYAPSGPCEPVQQQDNGPYDYRTVRDARLTVVEKFHFTPLVENLIKGSTGELGQDLDFTLRAFPNHHRALVALVRLGKKQKVDPPVGARYGVQCYFMRAISFQPNDVVVRLLFAGYLAESGQRDDYARQMDAATQLATNEPFTNYNLGLIAFEAGDFDRAILQARRAAELGFTRPELRQKLIAAGKWKEPEAAADAGASAPNPAASAARP